jgi:restriction endonuclease S subunit
MEQRSSGGYYPAIAEDELKKILIPLPSKEIQQQIIDIYNQAVEEKQTKEQETKELLASIDEYLLGELGIELPENVSNERYFEMSIWDLIGGRLDTFYNNPLYAGIDEKISSSKYPFKKFKEICYSVSGVVYSNEDESEKGKAILRGNNITLETNELNFESIRYIRDSFNISDNLKLQKNDILMSSASGSKEHVGKVVFIENDMDYYFGGFMMVLRQKENNYNQKYFFAFLQSKLFRSYLYRNLGGTNINNLTFNMLSHLKVPFPPIEKQDEIAEYIQSIRTKVKQLQEDAKEGLEKAKREVEKMIENNN